MGTRKQSTQEFKREAVQLLTPFSVPGPSSVILYRVPLLISAALCVADCSKTPSV